jgi:cytochrome d ubiquinol oxidase subunit II
MEWFLILKVTWWLLLGVLLAGLGTMVGMDMGVGASLRFLGRSDSERRAVLGMIGPHWDGNQVWFILGGGAIFAAWSTIYATAFSGLYIVMLVLLWSMIVRPLGFEYRNKLASSRWRSLWDYGLLLSGAVPMVIFGAAIGNMLLGVPFHFDWNMQSFYTGSFLDLFNPFALLCGLLALSLALYQAGAMVMGRGTSEIHARARKQTEMAAMAALVLFTVGGVWTAQLPGFVITSEIDPAVAVLPLHKTVAMEAGAWLGNFRHWPWAWTVPALAYLSLAIGTWAARRSASKLAWWMGASAWAGVIGTVGVAMFPFMMPSSSTPDHSLTVWDASAGERTLAWMLVFTIVFLPIVISYTSWCFWVMRGKVVPEDRSG